jgi:carbon storage regulator
MLVLTRRAGEAIIIADNIRIEVLAIHKSQARLGIAAPRSISIDREEVSLRRSETPAESAVLYEANGAPATASPVRKTIRRRVRRPVAP